MALNIPAPDFSNAKNLEEKFNILADSYYMLRKELEYTLQNLDMTNFNSISAKNITAKNVKGGTIEGTVIRGSSIEGGSININDAFVVDGAGNVVMLGTLNIAGKITVDANGNMTIYGGEMHWASSDPKFQDIDIELSNINGYLTDVNGQLITIDGQLVSMDGDISDLRVTANLAGTNIVKLSNGTYMGGQFIDGKTIQSPYIDTGRMRAIEAWGSKFRGPEEDSAYLIIGNTAGGNLGDLQLQKGNDGGITFQIYDDLTVVHLKMYGNTFMSVRDDGITEAVGDWDFSDANVTGITATFA